MKKERGLGLRYRKTEDVAAIALAVSGPEGTLVELYDIETGEAIGSVTSVKVSFDTAGVIEADVHLYLRGQSMIETQE